MTGFLQGRWQLDSANKITSFFISGMPNGVTVAQQILNLLVMVRIHVRQPSRNDGLVNEPHPGLDFHINCISKVCVRLSPVSRFRAFLHCTS